MQVSKKQIPVFLNKLAALPQKKYKNIKLFQHLKWKSISYILLLVLQQNALAQIMNIDRSLKQDSTSKKLRSATRFSFSSDKNRNNLIDLNISSELDRYFHNKYVFLILAKADVTFNGKQSLQNDGFVHIRYRDNDTRKLSAEEYIQYQWNGAWGMEYRMLGGANMRYKLIEKEHFDLYTGLGLFHEWERWNWSGVKNTPVPPDAAKIYRQSWRINNYWKISGKISNMVDIAAVTFLQFPFNMQFLHPRWYADVNAFIKTGNHFSIVLHWDHILDVQPAVPIDNFYYTFSTGFQLNF